MSINLFKVEIVFLDSAKNYDSRRFHELAESTVREVLNLEMTGYKSTELLSGIEFKLSISFVDNEGIRMFNKKFRRIDAVTDVLSFPFEEDFSRLFEEDFNRLSDKSSWELGDIVISIEKAIEQAGLYGHSPEREIAFLTAHSVLHLLGYDHENEADEKMMSSKQELALDNIGLSR